MLHKLNTKQAGSNIVVSPQKLKLKQKITPRLFNKMSNIYGLK
jgi:hypothetical protein